LNFTRRLRVAMPFLADLRAVWGLFFRHKAPVLHCPCCGNDSKFRLHGLPPRLNAICTKCGALERHRQHHLLLTDRPSLHAGRDILHFAPERITRTHLEDSSKTYTACDIRPAPGDVEINIEAIDFEDQRFDLIVCHQVLEHVDDRKALPELRRILRKGGTLILSTPVVEGWATTYENPAVETPADRLRHFGQEDHVRYYGADVRDRIRAAGFEIEEYTAVEPAVQRYGLVRGEKLFLCT
jgi:SAM-dependent methyltransferase